MTNQPQQFVRTVSDKNIFGFKTKRRRNYRPQKCAVRIGIFLQRASMSLLLDCTKHGGWRAERIFVCIQFDVARSLRLLARNIRMQRNDGRVDAERAGICPQLTHKPGFVSSFTSCLSLSKTE